MGLVFRILSLIPFQDLFIVIFLLWGFFNGFSKGFRKKLVRLLTLIVLLVPTYIFALPKITELMDTYLVSHIVQTNAIDLANYGGSGTFTIDSFSALGVFLEDKLGLVGGKNAVTITTNGISAYVGTVLIVILSVFISGLINLIISGVQKNKLLNEHKFEKDYDVRIDMDPSTGSRWGGALIGLLQWCLIIYAVGCFSASAFSGFAEYILPACRNSESATSKFITELLGANSLSEGLFIFLNKFLNPATSLILGRTGLFTNLTGAFFPMTEGVTSQVYNANFANSFVEKLNELAAAANNNAGA